MSLNVVNVYSVLGNLPDISLHRRLIGPSHVAKDDLNEDDYNFIKSNTEGKEYIYDTEDTPATLAMARHFLGWRKFFYNLIACCITT